MSSKLEELLIILGQPGRSQILGLFFLMFSFVHTIAMNYVLSFITIPPSHHCKLPETWQWTKNISIPQRNASNGFLIYDQCRIYKDPLNQSLGFEDCPSGEYEYIHTDGERLSAITEWGLVCDKKYLVRIFQTCYFVGILIGGFVSGFLADKYGRRLTWMVATIISTVVGITSVFVTNFETSCFLLFLRGIFTQSQNIAGYTLSVEIFPVEYRTKAGILINASPAFSLAYANLMAYFITEWRYQLLAYSLSSLITITGFWYVKESFRWMLSQDRIQQALTTAEDVAKFNRIMLPKNLESKLKAIAEEIRSTIDSDKKQSIIDLLRHPFMRWICLIICLNFFFAQISIYGFSFLISEIGGNVYLNFLIVAIADFLMRSSSYIAVEKFGRTMTSAITLLIMGVMNLTFTLTKTYQDDYPSLAMVSLVASLFGRAFNGMYFCAAVLQAMEIFPTTVRSTATGVMVSSGKISMLILPVILLMGDYIWKQMPFLVFGVGSVVGGILALFLPETRGIIIPDTIEEASKLRKRKMPSHRNGNLDDKKTVAPMLMVELN